MSVRPGARGYPTNTNHHPPPLLKHHIHIDIYDAPFSVNLVSSLFSKPLSQLNVVDYINPISPFHEV